MTKTTDNRLKWDYWWEQYDQPVPVGDSPTYQLGADFLADCDMVEDWGAGPGYWKDFYFEARKQAGKVGGLYRPIDGSHSPVVKDPVDLVTYRHAKHDRPDGIFMRHVLEHNYEYAKILQNALDTAIKKLCYVIFTHMSEETNEITFYDHIGVPDLSFKIQDVFPKDERWEFRFEQVESPLAYGPETIFYCTRL